MIKTFYNKNMTIYIEEFLLQNILINISLLKLIELTSKCRTTKIKMLCASIVGAAFSVICAMFIYNNIWMNVLKVMC